MERAEHNHKDSRKAKTRSRWPIPTLLVARASDPIERPFLHGHVCFDVHVSCGSAFVTEPESNNSDVDSRLEKVHCSRVAQKMRRNRSGSETRTCFRGDSTRNIKARADSRSSKTLASTARE
jgi:hypothetical protein